MPAMSAIGPASHKSLAVEFSLALPPTRITTDGEQLALLGELYKQGRASTAQRRALAYRLVRADRFEDALVLLQTLNDGPNFDDLMAAGRCHVAKETEADNLKALVLFEQALELVPGAAGTQAEIGKMCLRLGRQGEARKWLEAALRTDPTNPDAFKRINLLDIQEGRAAAAITRADAFLAGGIAHARVLSGKALALAALGRFEQARGVLGLDAFLEEVFVEPPVGWSDMAAFNRALAAEIVAHPGKSGNMYGAASVDTTRLNEPMITRAPLFSNMLKLLKHEIVRYVRAMTQGRHPFLAAMPAAARLRAWVVTTEADGFELWHVHQNGWLSGVYYVEVPEQVVRANDESGCLCFGLQPDLIGEENSLATGHHFVRPRAGKLLLFPSHIPHRTFLHGRNARRIGVAFDVIPVARSGI